VPILTANVVTAAAMLPFAIAGDEAGDEIVRSMAVVMLGALATSTLLILLVVPALYVHYGRDPAAGARWPWRRPQQVAGGAVQPQGGTADAG